MSKIKKLALAALIAVGLVAGAAVVANAAAQPDCKNLMYPLCARSVSATQVVDNSLPGYKKLSPGSVSEDRLNDAVKAKLNAPDQNTPDVKGSADTLWTLKDGPVVIDKIGGSFSANATKIGTFTLPKGTWQVNLKVKFNRPATAADGSPEVQPMIQLLADGNEYGTIMGNDIGDQAGADLTGFTSSLVPLRADTVVTVYAFGYNEAKSAVGSGLVNVESASVVAVAS